MVRHSWPELIVNQISRQRVAPRIGTRSDQMRSVIVEAFADIASRARERAEDFVMLLDGGADPSDICTKILSKDVIDDALDPVVDRALSEL